MMKSVTGGLGQTLEGFGVFFLGERSLLEEDGKVLSMISLWRKLVVSSTDSSRGYALLETIE